MPLNEDRHCYVREGGGFPFIKKENSQVFDVKHELIYEHATCIHTWPSQLLMDTLLQHLQSHHTFESTGTVATHNGMKKSKVVKQQVTEACRPQESCQGRK